MTSKLEPCKLFTISIQLKFASLGRAWINVVRQTLQAGAAMGNEGFERLGVEVEFPAETGNDDILKRFGDARMIADMQQVFFGSGQNPLGHSYASLIRGPDGRNDLQDVIALLRGEPWSKRAVITLCGNGHGKVPCINVVQFLIREGKVRTIYFARGQDAFRKFYADALCIASMARTVAAGLEVRAGTVQGFIGSCHIYHRDVPQICKMLDAAQDDFGSESFSVNRKNQNHLLTSAARPKPLRRGEGPALSPSARERFASRRRGRFVVPMRSKKRRGSP